MRRPMARSMRSMEAAMAIIGKAVKAPVRGDGRRRPMASVVSLGRVGITDNNVVATATSGRLRLKLGNMTTKVFIDAEFRGMGMYVHDQRNRRYEAQTSDDVDVPSTDSENSQP